MTPAIQFYTARQGFRETLKAIIGEDPDGYAIEREATVEEEHSAWVAAQAEGVAL